MRSPYFRGQLCGEPAWFHAQAEAQRLTVACGWAGDVAVKTTMTPELGDVMDTPENAWATITEL